MVEAVKSIKVFISSPSDMSEERLIARDICDQINNDIGIHKKFRVEPLMWETHTSSDIADRSQEAINNQLGEYDIYVGLMGFYFGTPTGVAASGTEEEFKIALDMNRNEGFPRIQFYFSSAKVDIEKIDLVQFDRVKQFRKKIGELGVYYKKFEDLAQFSTMMRQGLFNHVLQIIDGEDQGQEGKEPLAEGYEEVKPYNSFKNFLSGIEGDSELGSYFRIVSASRELDMHAIALHEMRKGTQEFSRAMGKVTDENKKLTRGSRKSNVPLLKAVERMLSTMEKQIFFFLEKIPDVERNFMSAMGNFQRGAQILVASGRGEDESLDFALREAGGMKDAMQDLQMTIDSMVNGFPEISELGERWKYNRQLYCSIMNDFSDVLGRAIATVEETVSGVREA